MMGFGAEFEQLGTDPARAELDREDFDRFAESLPLAWINEALHKTGKQSIRRRKLPSEVVIWLVIAMALFRNMAITMVLKYLGLAATNAHRSNGPLGDGAASSSITEARQRVGQEPLIELFDISSRRWSGELEALDTWRGLKVYAMDGTTLRIPDTEENDEFFGRPASGDRGKAAYPQARAVAVVGVCSRVLNGFQAGPYSDGEQTLAKPLWEKVPDDTLLIIDRGFINYGQMYRLTRTGHNRHWLCRTRKNTKGKLVEELGAGDRLVQLKISSQCRKEDPSLPKYFVVRMIDYQIKGFKPQRLMTSLLDPVEFPADELIRQYHLRWEIEIGYDEIKTDTLEQKEAIRSKSPDAVMQELWGLAVAYNIVRVAMARAAKLQNLPPGRLSYKSCLWAVRGFLVGAWLASLGSIPSLYGDLCTQLSSLVLPERRARRYPREVKIKMSNYKRKVPK